MKSKNEDAKKRKKSTKEKEKQRKARRRSQVVGNSGRQVGDNLNQSEDPFMKNENEQPNQQDQVAEAEARPRREIRNLQKFDSNSFDDQQFADYFDDPHKRKEYDKQRLQMQMRDIQNIAGLNIAQYGLKAMSLMPGIEEDDTPKKKSEKNFATVSLCCLSVSNPFRYKIIQMVAISPWFDSFILLVILCNCVFLALDNEVEFITENTDGIDKVFLIIYTCEMVLKIIAYGFIMQAHTYLRDSWNVLDFVVVILGWVSMKYADQDISAIRVIRILRPLRTINSMPGMSSLVATILNSLPSMFDIMVLFGFMLVMFGTIATQLLGGHLQSRCFKSYTDDEEQRVMLYYPDGGEIFCMQDQRCQDIDKASACHTAGNPMEGTFCFDNILYSMMNIFQIITLENWSAMMYIVRQSEQSNVFDSFFILCVVIGAFFVLNLMIAVQFTYLGEAFDEESRKQKILKDQIEQKIQDKLNQEEEDSFFEGEDDDIGLSQEFANDQNESAESSDNESGSKTPNTSNLSSSQRKVERKKGCFNRCDEQFKILREWSDKLESIMESKRMQRFVMALIMINTIFLASEHYGQVKILYDIQEYANLVFTILFALEMVLKLLGLGFKNYVQDGFNIFDSIVVLISLIEYCMPGEGSGLSVLRAFRLLRIFKIIKSWENLRILFSTVLQSLSAITNLGVLTMLYLFISSLLGKQFFGSSKLHSEDGKESRYDFSSTVNSFITIFIILTGEDWNAIMVQAIDQQQSMLPSSFFMINVILGHYMLLNLFLAILLKFITENTNTAKEKQLNAAIEEKLAQDEKELNQKNSENEACDHNVNLEDFEIQLFMNKELTNSQNTNNDDEFEQKMKQMTKQITNKTIRQSMYINERNQPSSRSSSPSASSSSSSGSGHDIYKEGGESKKAKKQKRSKKTEKEKRMKQNSKEKKKELSFDITIQSESQSETQSSQAKSNRLQVSSKVLRKKNIEIDETSKSLFLFASNNRFRIFLKAVVQNKYFDDFIYHMIALNSLLLALDTPELTDGYQTKTIQLMLTIISIIFIIEATLKIIVMGFFWGKGTFLKDSWNILDFIIVLASILNWLLEYFVQTDIKFVRAFRALRGLRPLRVVSMNEGIKTIVNSLIQSIPSLLNVLLIILLFLVVFGILGVQLFKGMLGSCNDSAATIQTKAQCKGDFEVDQLDAQGKATGQQETIQRVWILNSNNYDNVFSSILTFFEISTLEMWPHMMFDAIDGVEIDHVPKVGNNTAVSIVFILFIFLTTFFIMNLFISVIVDKFNEQIKKRQGADNFTREQKEWVKIQRLLLNINPKKIPVEPINKVRLLCFKIVQSSLFEYVIMLAIVINTLFLMLDHHGINPKLEKLLNDSNKAFVGVFTLECGLKITAYGFKYYWHVNWNKFDFFIVIISLIGLDENALKSINFNPTALRIIRVTRLLRMIKTSQGLRNMLKTLYMSLGNILTTGCLLVLMLFTFTVAGMNIFGQLKEGEYITKNTNFKSFYNSMMTLWRASTGESWNGMMHECFKQEGSIAIIFWILFELTTFFIFMNVFIAVIYENFNENQTKEDENDIHTLKKKDLKAFQNTWAQFNPMGEEYMRTIRLPDFLRELPPPLGYNGIKIEDSRLNHIIFCLNIKDHLGKVYYPEVMWPIFHSLVGVNDDKINKCEQMKSVLAVVKRKYKGLGNKVTLDILCGNKYYKQEITASKYIQALKIWTKWKAMESSKRKKKKSKAVQQDAVISNNNNKQKEAQKEAQKSEESESKGPSNQTGSSAQQSSSSDDPSKKESTPHESQFKYINKSISDESAATNKPTKIMKSSEKADTNSKSLELKQSIKESRSKEEIQLQAKIEEIDRKLDQQRRKTPKRSAEKSPRMPKTDEKSTKLSNEKDFDMNFANKKKNKKSNAKKNDDVLKVHFQSDLSNQGNFAEKLKKKKEKEKLQPATKLTHKKQRQEKKQLESQMVLDSKRPGNSNISKRGSRSSEDSSNVNSVSSKDEVDESQEASEDLKRKDEKKSDLRRSKSVELGSRSEQKKKKAATKEKAQSSHQSSHDESGSSHHQIIQSYCEVGEETKKFKELHLIKEEEVDQCQYLGPNSTMPEQHTTRHNTMSQIVANATMHQLDQIQDAKSMAAAQRRHRFRQQSSSDSSVGLPQQESEMVSSTEWKRNKFKQRKSASAEAHTLIEENLHEELPQIVIRNEAQPNYARPKFVESEYANKRPRDRRSSNLEAEYKQLFGQNPEQNQQILNVLQQLQAIGSLQSLAGQHPNQIGMAGMSQQNRTLQHQRQPAGAAQPEEEDEESDYDSQNSPDAQ